MAERVVDELEAVEIQHRHGELMRLTVRLGNRLSDAVIEQQTVGQSGERVVRGEVPQLSVRRLESAGAIGDDPLEALDVALECACVLPLAAQRARGLQDLDGLERLLDDDELVGVPESRQELHPVVVAVGRADHDLDFGVDLPEVFDRFQPVPAGWHTHVHEGD